ncbi:MAG: carboxypeptidase-like regulatory domain-containing protein, partial [Planctomycetota bacterium]
NGNFSATLPGGVYRIEVRAPAGSSLVGLTLPNVVVAGTKNLGALTLRVGVLVSGRALDANGVAVGGVNLDVVELATGIELAIDGDHTNAFGNFSMLVPKTALELQFRCETLAPPLAPRALQLTPLINLSIGDVVLAPGLRLQGHVQRTNGQALASVDLDLRDSVSGLELFTPGDNTDSGGNFSVVVPAGQFDLELCPRTSDLVVARELLALTISANTNLGNLVLQPGFLLSGLVSDAFGAPLAGVDVDARVSATGVPIVLCGDNSDASGNYGVVVPAGTFDVSFTPGGGACALPVLYSSVVVSAATTRNATLPASSSATATAFAGDGHNLDVLTPVPVVIGSTWTAPLTLGHAHGTSGILRLKIKTTAVNGPNFLSPSGGRLTELLIGGPTLAVLAGAHNGTIGGIAPRTVPASSALLGQTWACQYTVTGGGFVDLSRAAFGVVGCP